MDRAQNSEQQDNLSPEQPITVTELPYQGGAQIGQFSIGTDSPGKDQIREKSLENDKLALDNNIIMAEPKEYPNENKNEGLK